MTICPSPELLSGLLASTLTGEDEASVRAHLAGCPSCRTALDRATDDPELARWADRAATPSPFEREVGLARLVKGLEQVVKIGEVSAAPRHSAPALGPPRVEGDLGTIGRYRILKELGRGGLGVVLHGYDEKLARPVAIKLLHPERIDGDTHRHLAREARNAARFRHDNVVIVYGVEETAEGVPFIVMEYIPGPSVAQVLHERTRLAPREAAELVAQVADGLAAAHAAGLIHRDMKPANILVDPATGRARIVDFGLALVPDAPGSIAEGAFIGTPSYMSPEQANARGEVDAQTDQYSLGASLYEMLTGEPPFRGTPAMVVHQVLEEEPRPPRQLSEAVPRELETICLKTLSKDPRQRYPSTAMLAADLRCWLRGEPIIARPVGPIGRLVRWSRRNRRVAFLATTTFLLLTTLAAGALVAAALIDRERRTAIAERARADRSADDARESAKLAADRARVALEQRTLALDTISTLINEAQQVFGQSAGTLAVRRRLADAAMARLDRIATDSSTGPDVGLARVMAQEKLGELSFLAGRTDSAKKYYESARDLAQAVASSAGGETAVEANRLLALTLDKLGDLDLYAGAIDAAQANFQRSISLRNAMPETYRDSPEGRRNLAVSQNKVGDAALRSGRLDEARAAFERGLALTENDMDPDAQRHRFDLRFSHSRLGDVALAQFDLDAADSEYHRALQYAEEQLAANPNDVRARREAPVCYSKLGGVALRRADPASALEYYRKYLAGSEALAAANPTSAEARRDLEVAQSMVGDALVALQQYSDADRFYSLAIQLAQSLSKDDPSSLQKRIDIHVLIAKIASANERRERFDDAARWYERVRENTRALAEAGLITQARRAELDQFNGTIEAVYRQARRALDEPAWIPTQPAEMARRLWAVRCLTLARRGNVPAAAEAAEALRKLAPNDVECLVVVARTYSLCARAASRPSAKDPASAPAQPEVYTDKAMTALKNAFQIQPDLVRNGWLEPDFDPLYRFPEYRRLIAQSVTQPGVR